MSSPASGPIPRQRRRRSSQSTAHDALSSVKHTAKQSLLLLWDELPAWRRDNAYIVSGYRHSNPSLTHVLCSLTTLHNESVNIWSHLVGALLALATGLYLYCVVHPRYRYATPRDVFVFGCFFAGAAVCLGMSATYHTILHHSEPVARWGNKLDYTGIVFLIVGSFVPALYYGFYCHPTLLTSYLSAICLLGVACTAVSWLERFRTPQWRPYRTAIFVALGLSSVFPVVHGIALNGYRELQESMSIDWTIAQGVLYIAGALLYAVRWPERSLPGTFDIWGSSHQIFHMFVLMAAVTHFCGLAKAFDHHHAMAGSRCQAR
ncbi:hypothetical protein CDD80_3402 [Ophiocordyceps camponoti-rufipedis]|uniref:Uncharacterized protein n=1 Tax=Ophiocordyceps camponoti-rufipedis TaxID=2004952 RepID=A0A2C5Z2M7_9HYPO|nr:hypothetical protein CDD80_3402 [Ophiocordyceps camponoti-rufipedis]